MQSEYVQTAQAELIYQNQKYVTNLKSHTRT